MTVMRAREVRTNLILSIATAVLGVLMRLWGTLALKFNWFLPEYDATIKGCGGVLVVLGLIWVCLTAIKRVTAPPEKAVR